jgi:hypothetical protein
MCTLQETCTPSYTRRPFAKRTRTPTPIFTHTSIQTHTHRRTRTHTHIHTHMHMHTWTFTYIDIHIYSDTGKDRHTCKCMHTYARACVRACMYLHHTRILALHAFIHAYIHAGPLFQHSTPSFSVARPTCKTQPCRRNSTSHIFRGRHLANPQIQEKGSNEDCRDRSCRETRDLCHREFSGERTTNVPETIVTNGT